jgi:MoaA/NifB/PqqE/SkfB family radical SAM enzyme
MTTRRRYDPQFKQNAVRIVREEGKSVREVASELEVAPETVADWVMEDRLVQQVGGPTGFRFGIDIEVTNRCNAKCHFCPRDATPHQGLMTPEVFTRSLGRAVEYRELVVAAGRDQDAVVSLCGLGEPLLNRNAPAFVSDVREAGIECELSTNASLLDERRGTALLEAGLQRIFINASDRDTSYEEVYRLPFERTRENIGRFLEMAEGRCETWIVLVDYKRDPEHLSEMKDYWRSLGASSFLPLDVINRGGSLFVDDMQFQSYPQLSQAQDVLGESKVEPICKAPFAYLFIGYDGNYYLCCSDWRKEVPLGSVFDTSFVEITRQKLAHTSSREPICKTCNHDPVNRMAYELRAIDAGDTDPSSRDALVAELMIDNEAVEAALRVVATAEARRPPETSRRPFPKRLIPVTPD